MKVINDLNILNSNIDAVKQNLKNNLSDKGVTVSEGDTLSVIIDKVNDVPSGIDWSDTGYTTEPNSIADIHAKVAQWYSEWDPANTKLDMSYTYKYQTITIFPKINTSNVTEMNMAFFKNEEPYNYYNTIEYVPSLNTSRVTLMQSMFNKCSHLKEIGELDTLNVTNMNGMFFDCKMLKKTPILDISSNKGFMYMFQNCISLKEVWFKGQPQSGLNVEYMFDGVTTTGTFYYDHRYNYSNIIAVIPSTWKFIAWNYDTNSPA